MKTLIRILDRTGDLLGSTVAWFTLLMMFVTCAIVIGRYGFNLGSIGLQESVMYLHGLVFMTGISWTLRHQGHVRVDIFYERFSPRTRAAVDLAGTVFFLFPFGLFLLLGSLDYVAFSFSLREGSAQPGGLPGVYLLKSLIPLMAFLLLLQGVSEACKAWTILISKQP